jgi:hypothetical protein
MCIKNSRTKSTTRDDLVLKTPPPTRDRPLVMCELELERHQSPHYIVHIANYLDRERFNEMGNVIPSSCRGRNQQFHDDPVCLPVCPLTSWVSFGPDMWNSLSLSLFISLSVVAIALAARGGGGMANR